MPAIYVANYINTDYCDARYAINRVSLCDAVVRDLSSEVATFSDNPVDGEQCWVDNYYSHSPSYVSRWHWLPVNRALNVFLPQNHHRAPVFWHYWSLNEATWLGDIFNGGVTAGLYLSVIGPGKNLQLSTEPNSIKYYFEWQGDFYYAEPPLFPTFSPGYMDFYNESIYPGKLPEPVTLVEPVYVEDARGYILTCEESENAVGYDLLVGSDPYRVMDYEVISDTIAPPNEPTKILEDVWWTVRARDAYGSTIYADPQHIRPTSDILDLYDDGRLDFKDFAIMAGYWQQNEPSVDIAPGPFGDGRVDIRDVAVISNYWLADLRLVAHWKLDEEGGNIAHDSIGANEGTAHGDPNWLPSGGELGGALEMDGTDDYVSTDFVLNPADGPFSAFAWVKAGGGEEVVVSQTDSGEDDRSWLAADSAGNLMTDLRRPGRGAQPLISEFTITGSDWHHIGLVCDGSYRRLYADGVEVAVDSQAQSGMVGADGGLHIGADSALSAASFWTGLIDDVRIYDQAVTP